MRHRRPVLVTLAAVCVSVALAAPSSAAEPAGDGELVDRYTQLVYELEDQTGSRQVNLVERTVDGRRPRPRDDANYEAHGRPSDRPHERVAVRLPERPGAGGL